MDVRVKSCTERYDLPKDYETLQELGDCYASIDQCRLAQCCYEKAASISPERPESYIGLGVVAMLRNNFKDARKAFKSAIKLDNRCANGYCGLGMVFEYEGKFAKAFDMYLKSLEVDGDNSTGLLGMFGTFSRIA